MHTDRQDKVPDYMGHRWRLRQRYDKDGFDNWHDYEILEYLLTFALPRRDTKPQAKELIRRFDSFHAVLEADPRQIARIPGLGPYTARFISVLYQTARTYAKTQAHAQAVSISTPEQVRQYLTVSMKGSRMKAFARYT